MAQSILLPVKNFDAALPLKFSFEYYGSAIKKNKLTIRDNASNAVIYEGEETSMKTEHTLAATKLENGKVYNATIAVCCIGFEEYDLPSNPIVFACYATPTLAFEGLIEGGIVENSSLYLNIRYEQAQGNLLSSYTVSLYDESNREIWNSGGQYPAIAEVPALLHQILYNLEDDRHYAVECVCESVTGLIGRTQRMHFTVSYARPDQFSLINAENISETCSVKISTNVIMIDGRSEPVAQPDYRAPSSVKLRGSYQKVVFDNGVKIGDDFELKLKCDSINWYQTLCELDNGDSKVVIKAMKGWLFGETEEKCFFVLRASNGFGHFIAMSERFPVGSEQDVYVLDVQRKNNLYTITAWRQE